MIPGTRKFSKGECSRKRKGISRVSPLGSDIRPQPPNKAEMALKRRRMIAIILKI
jgi:hypothetical protein